MPQQFSTLVDDNASSSDNYDPEEDSSDSSSSSSSSNSSTSSDSTTENRQINQPGKSHKYVKFNSSITYIVYCLRTSLEEEKK